MRSQVLGHCVLGFTVFATLLWLDLLPTEFLRDALTVLLCWAAFSTLLVASAGAWVAYGRSRPRVEEARSRVDRRLATHRATHQG